MSEIDTIIITQGSKTPESPRCRSPSSPFSSPLPNQLYFTIYKEKRLTISEADGEPLLLGIPNDITFLHIAPKLRWTDFYALREVSPAWCRAIRSRQVYDARVRTLSTETLVLFCYRRSKTSRTIALYSRTDKAWYELPSIPKLDREITD